MIELIHGGPNGHSASVLIALAEKGLAYRDTVLDLAAFEQHRDSFLAVNAAGQVPILIEDGRRIGEAFFILLYLDDRYPQPPLGGADARARYGVQKWGKYVETHIAPNLAILGWDEAGGAIGADAKAGFARLTPERRALWDKASDGFAADEVAAARAALVTAVDRVVEDLAATSWLAGDDYSLADIVAYPHLARFAGLGIAVPEIAQRWIDRIAQRTQVRAALGAGGLQTSLATMGPERGRWG